MKRWTVEVDIEEGCDEFWEDNPSPNDVLCLVGRALAMDHISFDDIKITKIVDNNKERMG